MVPLFGAILTSSENEASMELLLSFLRYQGLKADSVNAKNWKDKDEGIRVFSKPTPMLAAELLEWSIESLLYGNFTDAELEAYFDIGVVQNWKEPITSLFHMPIFMLKPGSVFWSICTGHPKFDRILSFILRSFGQNVSVEGEFSHLISRIRTNPVNIVIFDWDQKYDGIKNQISKLKTLKEQKEFLVIGLKDFGRDNLYRDLAYGITEISPSLFSYGEIIEVIVRSFPIFPIRTQNKNESEDFKKILFEFQEKSKPVRYSVVEDRIRIGQQEEMETQIHSLTQIYRWLFKRSFHK